MTTGFRTAGVFAGALGLSALVGFAAHSAGPVGNEKYSAQVPGGLAFSEFRGYESWETISVSHGDKATAVILGNPEIVRAFKEGIPENGKPFPDGAKMAKVHWIPKKSELAPSDANVPGQLHDVDFMVKDSKRFADSGGWGYGFFKYDRAAGRYIPATVNDQPPQENDAKCGAACHQLAQSRDYVFTEYAPR
jgi:hypothetical protein